MSPKIQLVFLTILLVFSASGRDAAGQARATPAPRGAPVASPQPAVPLSVTQVIEALYSLGVTKTEDLIIKNKVRFEATPEIVEILKDLGATDKLLSSIPSPAPKPVPTPVVEEPKVSGPLQIGCEPSDCIVVVNQQYFGSTESHNKTLTKLPPGSATVQVISNGYVPQTQQVVLQEGRPAEARFRLALTTESRHAKGQQLLLEAFHALGGIPMTSLMQDFQGDGILEWRDEKGTTRQGSMKFAKNLNQNMQLEFKVKDGSCTSTISGKTSKQACKGSLKNAEGTASDAASSLLLYEVENVMADILAGTPTLSGSDAAPRMETYVGEESYVLTLNDDKLPAELVHTRGGRATSVVTVTYSDYVNLNSGKYPSRLAISRDGSPALAFSLQGISTRAVKPPK